MQVDSNGEHQLLEAIANLRRSIASLAEALDKDYIKATEIEARFSSKKTQSRIIATVFGMFVIALVTSYSATVSTVSVCFLGDLETQPDACYLIPEYEHYLRESDRENKLPGKLDRRLDRIEKEVFASD